MYDGNVIDNRALEILLIMYGTFKDWYHPLHFSIGLLRLSIVGTWKTFYNLTFLVSLVTLCFSLHDIGYSSPLKMTFILIVL